MVVEGRKLITLDLPMHVVDGLGSARSTDKGKILRRFLEDEVSRCYDRRGNVREISIKPGLMCGEKARVGLTIVESTLERLDGICEKTPFSRKALAEYLIASGYERWRKM